MMVNGNFVDEDFQSGKFIPTGAYVLAHPSPGGDNDGLLFWISANGASTYHLCLAKVFETKDEAFMAKEERERMLAREGRLFKSGHHPLEGRLFVQEVFLRKVDEVKGE